MSPSSLKVDWPVIAEDPERWGRAQSWPLIGEVQLEVAGDDPSGLLIARERIAEAAAGSDAWPGHCPRQQVSAERWRA